MTERAESERADDLLQLIRDLIKAGVDDCLTSEDIIGNLSVAINTARLAAAGEQKPVAEVWRGDRKVTVYQDEVIRVWGVNIDDEMSSEPSNLETVQSAFDWLYTAPQPAAGNIDPRWRTELDEIVSHLGAAVGQSVATDDQIIMGHVKAAHEIAKVVRRQT